MTHTSYEHSRRAVAHEARVSGRAPATRPAAAGSRSPLGRIRARAAHFAGSQPWWAIAGWAAIAVLALVLYLWSLSRNDMANSYYAAAVKSAARPRAVWQCRFERSFESRGP